MKRITAFSFIVALAACASPKLQTDIFAESAPDMEKVDSECADKTTQKKNKHVAAVNCRFDEYEYILGERGFQEYNDLEALKKRFLDIAKLQDTHKIADAKAIALSEKYTQEFFVSLQKHDTTKLKGYNLQNQIIQQDIQVIAYGLSTGLQAYSSARYPVNSSAYQPAPCPACDAGIQQGQQWEAEQLQRQQEQQQQQETDAQQQQIQQQQNEINRLNGRSPAEKLRDCAQAGNCAGAFAAPYPQDIYGSYGSVPAQQ